LKSMALCALSIREISVEPDLPAPMTMIGD
jgi:hypothetical protein